MAIHPFKREKGKGNREEIYSNFNEKQVLFLTVTSILIEMKQNFHGRALPSKGKGRR